VRCGHGYSRGKFYQESVSGATIFFGELAWNGEGANSLKKSLWRLPPQLKAVLSSRILLGRL
jgi:hypothetical protein